MRPETRIADRVLEDVLLISTELVTSSALLAGLSGHQAIDFALTRSGGRLRIEVVDSGRGIRATPEHVDLLSSALGLRLIEAIACRWGVDRHRFTRVWVELYAPRPLHTKRLGPSRPG